MTVIRKWRAPRDREEGKRANQSEERIGETEGEGVDERDSSAREAREPVGRAHACRECALVCRLRMAPTRSRTLTRSCPCRASCR
jgi:hypothetical protein